MKKVVIYTDGACRGNPGPGGWGALLQCDGQEKCLSGGESETTNNRMELMAAIEGLKAIKHNCDIILYTDSTYVKNGITQWITHWKKNGWKTAGRKDVKNADLWKLLDAQNSQFSIEWCWVKGHSNNPGNEKADELARLAVP